MNNKVQPPQNLLMAFERIVEGAEKSKLSDEFFTNNSEAIQYVATRLELSNTQVVMLALVLDLGQEGKVSLTKIADYLGCRTTRILRLTSDFEELERLRYIKIIYGHSSQCYRVPKEVVRALSHNEPYIYQGNSVTDVFSFFDEFRKKISEKEREEITYAGLKEQVDAMLGEIRNTQFARQLQGYKLSSDELLLFIYMTYLYIDDNNDDIRIYELERLYDDEEVPFWCRRQFHDRSLDIITKQLIENVMEEGMGRTDAFRLTEKAKQELLGELNLNEMGTTGRDLLRFENLTPKNLFYNLRECAQIKELQQLLNGRKFQKVQQHLKEAGLRTGFCCLFHGSPGTGKTETVYQIARATKRNILQVDVDKIKSCWVGESEKNIKALFNRYRNICKKEKDVPILLFNEADAVLGVRMEGVAKAVDKMENSLQNIILQEMENLPGIMIATTNLTTNLDKAFDRRFLYKIKFDRPDDDTRSRIWKSLIPELKKKDATMLGSRFDLSGGEIENVARKHKVNAVLSLEKPSIDRLVKLCQEEIIRLPKPSRIGF